MDLRRIIKFGTSSYVVSLPKSWVNKNKLDKGDLLYFNENGNNELVLSPRDVEKKKNLSRINIDIKGKPLQTIRREIMSAYISNHAIIKITGDLKKVRPDIDNMLHGLLALEIMEDTPERIVVKDFLNLNDISLSDVVKRMDVMVRTMMNDADTSFKKNMYDKLSQLDKSVNKLMFLVFRVVRGGMKDPAVLQSLKVNCCTDLLDYWLIADKLEGIADDTRRIARFLKKSSLSKQETDDFKAMFDISRENYAKAMKAFYSNNIGLAHEVATGVDENLGKWDDLFNRYNNQIIGPLVERFKAINGQIRSIARIVVDRSMGVMQIKLESNA